MSNQVIKPTIGRVVLFWPSTNAVPEGFAYHDPAQPCSAQIAYVWRDIMVNLTVTDQIGKQHAVTSVRLIQPHEPKPEGGFFCEWMPYQIGQAQREATREDFERGVDSPPHR